MNKKLYRLRNISAITLVWGVFCFFRLKIFLFIEKTFLLSKVRFDSVAITNADISFFDKKNLDYYLDKCKYIFSDSNHIEYAHEILLGNIHMLGQLFHFETNEWLKDPISGKFWPRDPFFSQAIVEKQGYGDVKYVMEHNKMFHLLHLAECYYCCKDEEFLRRIKLELDSWAQEILPEKSVVNRILLDISFRCVNLLLITALCWENVFFQEGILPRITGLLVVFERQLRIFCTPRHFKLHSGSNHTVGEMCALLAVQNALRHLTNNKKYFNERVKSQEINWLKTALDSLCAPSGAYAEQSAAYGILVTEFLIFLKLFKFAHEAKISKVCNPCLQRLCHWLRNISSDSGEIANFGDSDGAAIMNFRSNDLWNVREIIAWADHFLPQETKDDFFSCPQTGQFFLRRKQTECFVRAGKHSWAPPGTGSHAHNDLLSPVIWIKGHQIVIDPGTYYYNSGLEIRNNDRCTRNHNTVSFDNLEQASFGGKWDYEEYPQTSGQLSSNSTQIVFSGVCSRKGRSHKREISIDNNGTLVIRDLIDPTSDEDVTWSMLLAPDLSVKKTSQHQIILFLKDGCPISSIEWGNRLSLHLEDAFYSPCYGQQKKTVRLRGKIDYNHSQDIIITIKKIA